MNMIGTRYYAFGAVIGLCILGLVCPCPALADEPPEKDFATFRAGELAQIEAKLAAIPTGAANDPLLAAAKSAARDAEAVVAEAAECFDRVRSATVGGMVGEAIGVSSKKPARAVALSHADQIRDVYVKYHNRLAKAAAATTADTPEAKIVRQYINATLAAAEKFILNRAAELDTLGEGTVAAEWAALVPLLCYSDADWNKQLVAGLPEWMRKMQALRAAEYVCLAVARPKAGYCLWAYQVSGDQDQMPGLDSYLANLHRRANACFGSKDFLKGIAVLKATIVLADAEKMTDEAVKSHFRMAEVYTMYGHGQLAADEMKLVMANYPDHKERGQAVVMRLKYLYQSGMFDKILEEAPAMLDDKAVASHLPQIIYIAWVANRRQDKSQAADDLQKRLIRDYPDHSLCADVYFASAMNLLASGDYLGAQRVLEMISEKYPKTSITAKCSEILSRIKENQRKSSESPATKPSGV